MCPEYENLDLCFKKNCATQLLMTVDRVNSFLASLYEIMLCFSYLLEIMDEFQVPQQVKQSLVYTQDLSTMRVPKQQWQQKIYLSKKNICGVELSCITAFHS